MRQKGMLNFYLRSAKFVVNELAPVMKASLFVSEGCMYVAGDLPSKLFNAQMHSADQVVEWTPHCTAFATISIGYVTEMMLPLWVRVSALVVLQARSKDW